MTKKATKVVSALVVAAAIATILGFVLNLTRGEPEKGGDTYSVESHNQSGGITAGKVENLVVNPQKPKLVLSPDKTKVKVTNGIPTI